MKKFLHAVNINSYQWNKEQYKRLIGKSRIAWSGQIYFIFNYQRERLPNKIYEFITLESLHYCFIQFSQVVHCFITEQNIFVLVATMKSYAE